MSLYMLIVTAIALSCGIFLLVSGLTGMISDKVTKNLTRN
jgi:hypothetical protein